jgi:N-acetylated-alpha-linked acidic dipeptidase
LPTYNAYSIDGDVTAPLVYVNYGVPEDYEHARPPGNLREGRHRDRALRRFVARHQAQGRGRARRHRLHHLFRPARKTATRRAKSSRKVPTARRTACSAAASWICRVYPGDPLTPGVGATPDAKRLAIKEAQTLTKIPVLPISYGDAQPLLAALTGPVAPAAWRGALPITYRIRPGPAKVHLKLEVQLGHEEDLRRGGAHPRATPYPDEWIVRGNHHDAWVNGAEDPVSGTVALMEEARGAFAELQKQGWKPKRTMIYCVWDGEEEGLLGSTEWAEEHAEELRRHAAMYINSDANGRGFWAWPARTRSRNSSTAWRAISKIPESGKCRVEARSSARASRAAPAGRRARRSAQRSDCASAALGSGSDYTAFIDHLGIASLNLGFGGEDGGGIYHSVYDDFYWYTHFSDGDFIYGRALAQTAGTLP